MSDVSFKQRMELYTCYAYSYPIVSLPKENHCPPPELLNNPIVKIIYENHGNTKNTFHGLTVMNILGYIPIVGLIIGIARIILCQVGTFFNKTLKSIVAEQGLSIIKESMIVKGILECLSVFGIFNCIFDIVGTIKRKKAQLG